MAKLHWLINMGDDIEVVIKGDQITMIKELMKKRVNSGKDQFLEFQDADGTETALFASQIKLVRELIY